MKLFLSPDELKLPAFAGKKASTLNHMRHLGYRVPHFLVTPPALSQDLFSSPDLRRVLAKEAIGRLSRSTYCVRSNALVEDEIERSHAGIFKSSIGVPSEGLSEAIFEVLSLANEVLKGNLSLFSLIIQEYIPAEFSGVTFTRNPLGTRELVIEFTREDKNQVVSGGATPTREQRFHSNLLPKKSTLPSSIEASLLGMMRLEAELGWPQDIEWCAHGNGLTFLQCRPISTLTPLQLETFRYLDRHPALSGPHFFEKSELSEIAPRPKVFSFRVLTHLFTRGGPCDRVYRKYQIYYQPKAFLTRFGNELYVDREAELRSFFPSRTFLKKNAVRSVIDRLLVLPRSLWNRLAFDLIAARCTEEKIKLLEIQTAALLAKVNAAQDWKDQLHLFYSDYEVFFEVNLLASALTQRLGTLLKGAPITLGEALSEGGGSLAPWQLSVVGPVLDKVKHLHRLRDRSRVFFDSRMKSIEAALFDYATQLKLSPAERILFATPEEIQAKDLPPARLIEREQEYFSFSNWTLPASLRSEPIQHAEGLIAVSSGSSEGVLVTESELKTILNSRDSSAPEDLILWSELLEPRLHRYFPHIKGILADRGGLLSHLAILARESGVPVWVNFRPNAEIPLGSKIQVSNTGGVPVIRSASSRMRP